MEVSGYKIEERSVQTAEYLLLRESTNWSEISPAQAEEALSRDLYSVCVVLDGQTIGMARVIGDGAIYFYIQDLIVLPEHQRSGLGRLLMQHVEDYLVRHAPNGAFVGLMAAKGTEAYYKQFGYCTRPKDGPGMFKYIKR